ncbi:MAG: hypothetical protein RBU45_11090 [Myxococcota bacterium]|jgi:hypothetical protein|nr:hypothetical protein [Myxococcota bacterium]
MHDQATSLRYSRPLLGSLLIPVLLLGACTMKTRDYSELGEGEGEGCPAADCTPGAKRCDGTQVVEVCSDYDGDGCPEWGGGVDCPTGSRCEDGRCLAICLPECVPGQRVCSGRGYRTCGDADEDGCPDLSPAVSCEPDERCEDGRCVPVTEACIDACAAEGDRRCVAGGRQICGQFDEDECLDLSQVLPCEEGETCRDGECLPACTDECDEGEIRCHGEGFVTCGNFDRDLCLEFGPQIPCAEDERCDNGSCVPVEQPCEEECEEEGSRVCTADGLGFRQCGQYDADSCRELSAVIGCRPGETCQGGACRATCRDECLRGARRCTDEHAYAACGDTDDDLCLEWGSPVACDPGERCDNGACVDEGEVCADECPELGQTRCDADGVQTCGEADADDCREWTPTVPCPEGLQCVDGACKAVCRDECLVGEVVCSGAGTRSCGQHDLDDCRELGPVVPCPEGQSCSQGECRQECTDECPELAQRECTLALDAFRTCGRFDEDDCLDWSSPSPCAPNERCAAGICEVVCQDECRPGARRCLGERWQECGSFDADVCLEFGGGGTCDVDQACLDGYCQVACEDECAEGAIDCGAGRGRRTCGNYDADACREWSAPSPCEPHAECLAGSCVPRPVPEGVVINELLYDGYGEDDGQEFIELYGPPGTNLLGFRLVGINGSGGGEYLTVRLAGLIPADGFFLIVDDDAGEDLAAASDQQAPLVIQNGPDSLQLRWGDEVVDALGYGDGEGIVFAGEGFPARDVAAGQSLSRDEWHTDTDDNLEDFTVEFEPSPGTAYPCEPECPGEGASTCSDEDELLRCQRDEAGCLVWEADESCRAQGGHCVAGECRVASGCLLPTGVGPVSPLPGMKVLYQAVDVLPHEDGFAVASGSPEGVYFGLVDAQGVLQEGPTRLGGTAYSGWGTGVKFAPSLARSDTQLAVVWESYEANRAGNCPTVLQRLTLEGQPVSSPVTITDVSRSSFNPLVTATDWGFFVLYNDYWQIEGVDVDEDGFPGTAWTLSDRYEDTRRQGYVAVAPASWGHALAFVLTTAAGPRVFFQPLDEFGDWADGELELVPASINLYNARPVYLFRISTSPERFGLFWQGTADDEQQTAEIHYAVLDEDGWILSRVRLNDLNRPAYLPALSLRHVLQDGDRFGVVHQREFGAQEPRHFAVQWLDEAGTPQGRTELGDKQGLLARLPGDGHYRLFITSWTDGGDDLQVATLSCP